jgi:hypothetical protein
METKLVALRDFPVDLFRKIKAEAALRDVTVTQVVVEALRLRPRKQRRKQNGT